MVGINQNHCGELPSIAQTISLMNPVLYGAIFSLLLAIGIIVLLEVGRRIGARRLAAEGEDAGKGSGAIVSAVFALLGLILAFSFSGALNRFDTRRLLVVEGL